MKTVVILASSRSNGNTRKIVDYLISITPEISLIDLNEYSIGYFDYNFKNSDDDFINLIKRIVDFDQIIKYYETFDHDCIVILGQKNSIFLIP